MQDTYSISELGKEFGITTRAIRFYEDKQLLSPTRNGQRRVYTRADRTRLKLLLRGKRLGWPLEEIRTVLDMYEAGDEGELQQIEYTCRKVEERREQLKQQRRDIEAALEDLDQIQQRCETYMKTLKSNRTTHSEKGHSEKGHSKKGRNDKALSDSTRIDSTQTTELRDPS